MSGAFIFPSFPDEKIIDASLLSYPIAYASIKGAYGNVVVVQSRDSVNLARYKAVKYLKEPNETDKFHREVQTHLMLEHPHIVKCFGITFSRDFGWGLVMEFMEGGNLQEVITNRKIGYKTGHAINWCHQLLLALKHLAEKNIVHRDVNPRNILLSFDYRHLKLGDFGITVLGGGQSDIKGSYAHIAPEIYRSLITTSQADIYSFGITLWQSLARKDPFQTHNPVELMFLTINGKRPERTPTGQYVNHIYELCWDPDLYKRPTVADLEHKFSVWKSGTREYEENLINLETGKPYIKCSKFRRVYDDNFSVQRQQAAPYLMGNINSEALFDQHQAVLDTTYALSNRLRQLYAKKHELMLLAKQKLLPK